MAYKYKLEFNLEKNAIQYRDCSGHVKSIFMAFEDINNNLDTINKFSGKDAYTLGVIVASKNKNTIHVATQKSSYKLLSILAILFTTVLLLSNILSIKLVNFFGITITGALFIYPFSYIFDYIISDTYGYQNVRKIIWGIILSLVLFDIAIVLLIYLPPSQYWHYQTEVDHVFKRTLRTFAASTVAFAVSFFISSYILQKLKHKGVSLFKRVFSSLLLSEISDTGLFCLLAFYGTWPLDSMLKFLLISYLTKVTYELSVFYLITKPIILQVKKIEKLDIFDTKTNFTPFSCKVDYTESDNRYID